MAATAPYEQCPYCGEMTRYVDRNLIVHDCTSCFPRARTQYGEYVDDGIGF